MKMLPALSAAVVMTLCAVAAHAQSQAAGLWEQTMTMKSGGGETDKAMADMQKELAAMPPEQRRQMEQMMAGRGMGPQGTSVKVCVSKEQASRPAEPALRGDCKNTDVKRNGNSVKFRFECTRPQPSSGEGDWTFVGDKAYRGHLTSTTHAAGKPQRTQIEMTGKWLAADCGDVKPRAQPGT